MCPIGKLLSPDASSLPPSINKKEATDLLWRSNLPPFQNYTVEHFLPPFFWEIDRDAAAAGFSLFHLSCVSSYVRGEIQGGCLFFRLSRMISPKETQTEKRKVRD